MTSLDEIRSLLSSDKVILRKRGKNLCETFMMSEPNLQMMQTMELISATISYEIREIQAFVSKGKLPERGTVIFVKNVVRFCQQYGSIKSIQMSAFLKHQLDIFEGSTILNIYKAEHVVILTDLLEQRLLHDIPFNFDENRSSKVGLSQLFVYTKDKMSEKSYCLDRRFQNLLKALCSNLFLELPESPSKVLKPLVKWLVSLSKVDAADEAASLSLCVLICNCLTSIMSLYGISIISIILRECSTFLSEICRQCFNRNLKEYDLNNMIGFLNCILDHAFQGDEFLDVGIRQRLLHIYPVLDSVQNFLLENDFLSLFCNLQRSKMTHRILGKDSFANYLQDTKTVQYFRFFSLMTRFTAITTSPPTTSSSEFSSPKKRQRTENLHSISADSASLFPWYWRKLLSVIDSRHVDSRDLKSMLTLECVFFHIAFVAQSWNQHNRDKVCEYSLTCCKQLLQCLCKLMRTAIHVDDKQVLGSFFLAMEALMSCLHLYINSSNSDIEIVVFALQQEWLAHEQRINQLLHMTCQVGSVSEVILSCFCLLLNYPSSTMTSLVKKSVRTWAVFQRYQDVPSILLPIIQLKILSNLDVTGSAIGEKLASDFLMNYSYPMEVLTQFLQGQVTKYCEQSTAPVAGTTFSISSINFSYILKFFNNVVEASSSISSTSTPKQRSSYRSFLSDGTSTMFPAVWYQESNTHWLQYSACSLDASFVVCRCLNDERRNNPTLPDITKVSALMEMVREMTSKVSGELLGGTEGSIISQDFNESVRGISTVVVVLIMLVSAISSQFSADKAIETEPLCPFKSLVEEVNNIHWELLESLLQYLKSKLSSSVAIDFVGTILQQLVLLTNLLPVSSVNDATRDVTRKRADRIASHISSIVTVCNGNAVNAVTLNSNPRSSSRMSMDGFDEDGFDEDFAVATRSNRGFDSIAFNPQSAGNGGNAVVSPSGTAGDRNGILRLQAACIALFTDLKKKQECSEATEYFKNRLLLVRKSYGSEGVLCLAELLATYRCFPAVMELIQRSTWHTEWNSLGYSKVLFILHEVLSSAWFWDQFNAAQEVVEIGEESEFYSGILDILYHIIVPEEGDVLNTFVDENSHVRKAQLLCLSDILKKNLDLEGSDWKMAAKAKFCKALQDSSLSVRLVASEGIVYLFHLFAKKQKVYDGIIECFPCGLDHVLYYEDDGSLNIRDRYYQDPLEIVIIVKTLTKMISDQKLLRSHPIVFRMGMKDLLRVYAILLSSDWVPVQPLQQGAGNNFALHILSCAWSNVAKSLQYRWLNDMLDEHNHWIVNTWLQQSLKSSSTMTVSMSSSQLSTGSGKYSSEVLQMILILHRFPYPLFSKLTMETTPVSISPSDWALQSPIGESKEAEVSESCMHFYTEYRGVFVSAFATLSQRQRWWSLQALCAVLGLEQSDHSLHSLVRESLVDLRASELWLLLLPFRDFRPMGFSFLGSEQCDELDDNQQLQILRDQATEIDSFVQRMFLNDHDRIALLRQQATWLVCQLLTVEIGRSVDADAESIQNVQSLTGLLLRMLASAAEKMQLQGGSGELLELVNLQFVCTWLHHTMQCSRLVSSHVHILAALQCLTHENSCKIIILQDPSTVPLNGSTMGTMAKMLRYSVSHYPDAITLIGKLLIDCSKGFTMAMDGGTLVSIDNLRLFVGEAVMIWNYLRIAVSLAEEEQGVNEDEHVNNNGLLSAWTGLVQQYFRGMLKTIVDTQSLRRLESVLLRSILSIVTSWEKRHPEQSFSNSVLPLSEVFLPSASTAVSTKLTIDMSFPNLLKSSQAVCDGHQTSAVLIFQLVQLDCLRQSGERSTQVEDWLLQLHVTAQKADLPVIRQMTLDMIVGDSKVTPTQVVSNKNVSNSSTQLFSTISSSTRWSTTLDSLHPNDLQVAQLEQKIFRLIMRYLAIDGDCFRLAQQTLNQLQLHQVDILPMAPKKSVETFSYPNVNITTSTTYYFPNDAKERKNLIHRSLESHVQHIDCLHSLTKQYAKHQYTDWIRMCVSVLVEWVLSNGKSPVTSSLSQPTASNQLTRSTAITSASQSTNTKISSTVTKFLSLIASLSGMIVASVEVAETLFPLLLMHLYSQQDQYTVIWDQLQVFMMEHLLQPAFVEPRVIKLVCYTSFMIIRKYHERFVRLKKLFPMSSSNSAKTQLMLRQLQAQMAVLYRTFPSFPLAQLAKVSFSVGLHYTAVYFVEWAKDGDLLKGIDQVGATPAQNQEELLGSLATNSSVVNTVFLAELYQHLDNPDAVDGLDITQNLRVQCVLQLNRGEYLEALSTAESILASNNISSNDEDTAFAQQVVVAALQGLGCRHTTMILAAASGGTVTAAEKVRDLGKTAQTALSEWNLPDTAHLQKARNDIATERNRKVSSLSSLLQQFPSHSSATASAATFQASNSAPSGANGWEIPRILNDFRNSVLKDIYYLFTEQESRETMMEQVSLYRQLSQIVSITGEVTGTAGQRTAHEDNPHVFPLKEQLLTQLKHHKTAEEARYVVEIAKLLQQSQVIHVTESVEMIGKIVTEVTDERFAHAVSPLLYATWSQFRKECSALSCEKEISAYLHFQECMLLWTKGARQVAVSKLRSQVIQSLSSLSTAADDSDAHVINSRRLVKPRHLALVDSASSGASTSSLSVLRSSLKTRALMTAGRWLSDLGACSAERIFLDYFLPSTSSAILTHDFGLQVQAHKATGDFCASVFDHSVVRLQSQEWQESQRRLQESEQELSKLNTMKTDNIEPSVLNYMRMIRREIDNDKKLRETVYRTHDEMLNKLIHHYSQVLLLSPEGDEDTVFRLVGYWLSNARLRRVNETLATTLLDRIATYKMVPLQYQIFSRLGMRTSNGDSMVSHVNNYNGGSSTDDDCFQNALRLLITRMCCDHPYHTLPQLFALVHENTVDSSAYRANMSSNRVDAAYRIVHSVRQVQPVITDTMERTLRAYIQLAKAPTTAIERSGNSSANKNIPFDKIPLQPLPAFNNHHPVSVISNIRGRGASPQQELKYFNELLAYLPSQPILLTNAVPLSRLPIDGSSKAASDRHFDEQYANNPLIVRITMIEKTFDITDSGISRPKIIKVLGSDGRSYRQLVKGGDDMRQDAVMQQVFATINFTLQQQVATNRRALHVRTYRVMPTSPQTGIIEWVENTEAFGGIINGDGGVAAGLHQRYYPQDWHNQECRAQLKNATDKEECYGLICQQFRPSFRFFFLESFPDPQSWYFARLRYIRSVASNSMAGYILGVGDRHAQNILVDKVTGEVVHIDFGIVFEQGKLLKIPELVPFRLTRELLDGMGEEEASGTFRRCCEEVLHVLRQHARQLLTILEVVIHDPLYRWSLSPVQARIKQPTNAEEEAVARQRRSAAAGGVTAHHVDGTAGQGSSRSGKDAAERTLMRIRQKLQGYEDPTGDALKVEAHVDLLINEAKNPSHLARIFEGWAPWL